MPYTVKGKCVYKKDTGKKVGCTDGPVSKYLGALHANADEGTNHMEEDNQGMPVEKAKVEITDQDVRITRISMGIQSTSILHLGRRATPQEAEEIKKTVLDSDKGLAAAFQKRFGLREHKESMKLSDQLPKYLKENVAEPAKEDTTKMMNGIAVILSYLKKYPEKETIVMTYLQRHIQKNKDDLKKYDSNSNGKWDDEETKRRRADLSGQTRPPQG